MFARGGKHEEGEEVKGAGESTDARMGNNRNKKHNNNSTEASQKGAANET